MDNLIDIAIRSQTALSSTSAIISTIGFIAGLLRSFASRDEVGFANTTKNQKPKIMIYAAACIITATLTLISIQSKGQIIEKSTHLTPPEIIKSTTKVNTNLIILLHGWNGDAEKTWDLFPELITKDPSLSNYDVWPISYPTFLVRRNLNIPQMARWINETLVHNEKYNQYERIDIIAHSMGGLISRQILINNRLERDNKKFKTLVEIGTPHQGADAGKLLDAIGLSKGFSSDLSPGRETLLTIQDNWNSLKDRPQTYCITSPHDEVVNQNSAIFQCDEYLRLPQWSHTELVKPSNRDDARYSMPISKIKSVT